MSKSRNCLKHQAELADSFFHSKIKKTCLVNKHGIPKPAVCPHCKTCIEPNRYHLINCHQISCDSETLKKEIKCREYSKIYKQNFHSILKSNDNDSDSNNEFSSDVDHGKSNQIFLHQQKYLTQTFQISGFCVCSK